ncbi:MAG: hypothetical protein H6888_02785 [Nitratireductor sp.]|nr:hypothetical protein [Nitratireductor sp.]
MKCEPEIQNARDVPIRHGKPVPLCLAARSHARLARLRSLICGCVALVPALGIPQATLAQEVPSTAQEIIDDAIESALQSNQKSRGHGGGVCIIVVTDDGAIYNMPGTNRLTSSGSGGRPGRASVYASRKSYRLSIDPPLGFRSAPAGGNSGVVFSTSFSGNGATSFSRRPGSSDQKLREGVTRVEVDFVADRGNDTFPAGSYQAELNLRCE